MYLLTIDTGTTNTRVTLWNKQYPEQKVFRPVGVRNTAINNSNSELKEAIKNCIEEILSISKLKVNDISDILASGMITSNVGLVEVPHLTAPVGIKELSEGIVKRRFPEIVQKDISFIPGVKNSVEGVNLDNIESMDIMRGEEVEVMGLLDRLNCRGPALILLPGSHSKFISVNEKKEITSCVTTLAGELISLVTKNSIITSSINGSFANNFNRKLVLKGFEIGSKVGINRAAFTVRIMDQFTPLTDDEKANFLLGAILSSELKALKQSRAVEAINNLEVIIAGKEVIADALEAVLLEEDYYKNITKATREEVENLAGFGAIAVSNEKLFTE